MFRLFKKQGSKTDESFPSFVVVRNGPEPIDTKQLWELSLYRAAYDFNLFKEGWEKATLWNKLKFRWRAFKDPNDMIRRVLAVHCRELMAEVQKNFYEVRSQGL